MECKTPRLVILILGALIGVVASGCLLVDLGGWALVGGSNSWRQDNLPGNERAGRFLPHWDDYIYVQAESGRFYAQALNPKLRGNWREVESVLVGELGGQGHSNCSEPSQPWTPAIYSPAATVHGLECGYWSNEGEFRTYGFAILENGDLWRWRSP